MSSGVAGEYASVTGSEPRPPEVVAVVLTYNRCRSLRECLTGILAQTVLPSRIIVIDNASTDETPQMLAREFPSVEARRIPENGGYTGGLHAAVRAALDWHPDFIWFLDDDAIPDPTCLEIVLREMEAPAARRVGVIRPMVRDAVTGDVMGGGVSCGTLLRSEMAATVPLPPVELFMEFDDKIYGKLIRQAGYEIVRYPTALVRHPVRRAQTIREILRDGYRVNTWRLYYGVRNRIYYSLYMEPSLTYFLRSLAVAVRALILLTLFGSPRRGQVLVVRGIVDGLRGRLGRRVAPAY